MMAFTSPRAYPKQPFHTQGPPHFLDPLFHPRGIGANVKIGDIPGVGVPRIKLPAVLRPVKPLFHFTQNGVQGAAPGTWCHAHAVRSAGLAARRSTPP